MSSLGPLADHQRDIVVATQQTVCIEVEGLTGRVSIDFR